LLALLAEVAPLPPALIFHAYGGSPETAAALLRLADTQGGTRVYFGVSPAAARLKRAVATISSVPADRLLLESDAHAPAEALASVAAACEAVAAARGWTPEQAARITARNAEHALRANVEVGTAE
jgi:Tat protein secretion system quality control protein TatD with DNase activity